MKIYRIFNPSRRYKTISYNGTPIFDNMGKTIWENTKEVSSYPYTWEKDEQKEICDCPFIIGSIPVFNQPAFNILSAKLSPNDIQVIPINVDHSPYYIVNAIHKISGILNKKKSHISYFSDGRIMDIEKYVFSNIPNIPSLFKIEELPIYTFVNEDIASTLEKRNITGVCVEQCKTAFSLF